MVRMALTPKRDQNLTSLGPHTADFSLKERLWRSEYRRDHPVPIDPNYCPKFITPGKFGELLRDTAEQMWQESPEMQTWNEDFLRFKCEQMLKTMSPPGTYVSERLTVEAMLENMPDLPYAQVATLPERGMKCRVVTKSPAALVTLGDKLRKILFRSLRRDRRIADSLEGNHEVAIERAFQRALDHHQLDSQLQRQSSGLRGAVYGKRGWSWNERVSGLSKQRTSVLSSDLTAASDLLPLDLVSALVEGFIEGSALGKEEDQTAPFLASLFRVLTGPQYVTWESGPYKENLEHEWTKRGILMGLPTTWFLLNLTHLFWIEESSRVAGNL